MTHDTMRPEYLVTEGGRALNAVFASRKLDGIEKAITLFLGSLVDFCSVETDLAGGYATARDIAEGIAFGFDAVQKSLDTLVERGYVESDGALFWLTDLIFDDYLEILAP